MKTKFEICILDDGTYGPAQDWTLTDDDSIQFVRQLGIDGTHYECLQVTELPDIDSGAVFSISHEIVEVSSLKENEIADILHLYGYDSIDDFVQETSPAVIERRSDGTLDKNSGDYIIDYGLIAEMLFEASAFECIEDDCPRYSSFDDATNVIKNM